MEGAKPDWYQGRGLLRRPSLWTRPRRGVAAMTPEATKVLMAWEMVSSRLTSQDSTPKEGRSVIQCYAPTNTAVEEEKEELYSSLQSLSDCTPRRDLKIIMGRLNAKVGEDNTKNSSWESMVYLQWKWRAVSRLMLFQWSCHWRHHLTAEQNT